MDKQPARDLVINGVSTAVGGHYRRVKIDGVGTVNGGLQADEMALNGLVTVRGEVKTEKLDADGKLKIEGHLAAGASELDGYGNVLGSVSGERFQLKGFLNVRGDCELESFEAEGAFDISGLLNAGFVDLSMYGRSAAREIGCEGLRVRKAAKGQWKQLLQRMFAKLNPELHVGIIEGDDLDLEYTVASVVRGNRITLGQGCRIGRVEYRSELRKHQSAQVGEEKKTDEGSRIP